MPQCCAAIPRGGQRLRVSFGNARAQWLQNRAATPPLPSANGITQSRGIRGESLECLAVRRRVSCAVLLGPTLELGMSAQIKAVEKRPSVKLHGFDVPP